MNKPAGDDRSLKDRPQTLFGASDEIRSYYESPWLQSASESGLRTLIEQRLEEALEPSSPAEAPPAVHTQRYWPVILTTLLLFFLATLISAGSIFVSTEREKEIVEQTTRFYSTEARILEEIRRETAVELARKNEEIARYQASLRRLEEQGASREPSRADRTDAFRTEQAAVFEEQETVQLLLARATAEREELLTAYRNIGTGARRDSTPREMLQGEESILQRFRESAVLQSVLRSQINEGLENVVTAVLAAQFDEARVAIDATREFIHNKVHPLEQIAAPETRFAQRVLSSFETLIDEVPDPSGEALRGQTRAQTLDAVDELISQLEDGSPASRSAVTEQLDALGEDSPQFVNLVTRIVAAMDAAVEYDRQNALIPASDVLVGTVALVRGDRISVERVAEAEVDLGDRLIFRRPQTGGDEITVATAVVDRLRGGFIEAEIDELILEGAETRLLDLAYRPALP